MVRKAAKLTGPRGKKRSTGDASKWSPGKSEDVSRSNALAIGATLLAMALGPEAAGFLEGSRLGRYFLFSQTGLAGFMNEPRPPKDLCFALAVIGAYLTVFYAAAWRAFTKRDVME